MTHRDDNAPSTPTAAQPAPPDTGDDLETFVRHIDRRQHMLYGKVAMIALGAWLVVSAVAFWALTPWTLGLMTCIGMLLFALFGMRAAIHVASRPLDDRVEAWRRERGLSHDELVEQARTTVDPRPEFFLSLVDGPMARQRRARRAASGSLPDPDVT